MLTEMKETDTFAKLGFDPSNTEAQDWMRAAVKLRDAIAKEKYPYQVADAPQVMIDLAKA